MKELFAVMRQQAALQASTRSKARIGIVTSVDPTNYCAKVSIQPEGTETGWLPVSTVWVGNGWGFFSPVSPGDMVHVQFQEDDTLAGFIVGRFFNNEDRAASVASGELWLLHETGSFIKLTNDGKLSVNGNVEIDATAPTINITATANVVVTAGAMATVAAPAIVLKNAGSALKKLCTDVFMSLYNSHTHLVGTTESNAPTQQATIGTHTTNIVQAE